MRKNRRPELYTRFQRGDLILTDELAIDRTLLANERTLLAYLRSSLALMIAGVTIIHFSQEGWYLVVGCLCIPVGVVFGAVGVVRYMKMNRTITAIGGRGTETVGGDTVTAQAEE